MPLRFDPMFIPEATTPKTTSWFLPGLLPRAQVVLLDGPSGVGKSRLAAALAAHATRGLLEGHPQPLPVLWLSLKDTFDEFTIPQLHEHQANLSHFRSNHGPRNEADKQFVLNFAIDDVIEAFSKFLVGFQNQLIIIDEPEELYDHPKANHDDHELFWYRLHRLAYLTGSCILVLRRPANPLSRQSKSLHHYGDHYSTLTLSLAWHPHDRTQRLLTVTRNKRGPTGAQHLITIDGPVSWTELHDEDHARPNLNTTPTTWIKKKPGPVSQAAHVIKQLITLLTEPQPAKPIFDHLLSQGYPKNSIRTALHHLGIKHEKRGKQWWYISPLSLSEPEGVSPRSTAGGEGAICNDESNTLPTTATIISRTSKLHTQDQIADNQQQGCSPDNSTSSNVEDALSPLSPGGRGVGGEGEVNEDESSNLYNTADHISTSSNVEDACSLRGEP